MPKTTLRKSLHLAGTPQLGKAVKKMSSARREPPPRRPPTSPRTREVPNHGTHKGSQRRPRRPATTRRTTRKQGDNLGALPGRRRGEQRRNHGKPDPSPEKGRQEEPDEENGRSRHSLDAHDPFPL